jgi:hypothetical protein
VTVQTLSYAIDEEDRLIRVDDGYYRFAEENGWDGAGASLGRSLWDFVAGSDVVKLQRLLLRRVREGVRDVEVEEAAKRLELFRRGELPTLDHGICPRCSGQLLAA